MTRVNLEHSTAINGAAHSDRWESRVNTPAAGHGAAACGKGIVENREERLSRTRLRVGIVDLDAGFSGITRYVMALLEGIDRTQFEPVLFCRRGTPYDALQGVRVVHVMDEVAAVSATPNAPTAARPRSGMRGMVGKMWRGVAPESLRHLAGYVRDARRLAGALKTESLDVLHVQVVGDAEGALAGWLAGIPRVVGTFHMNARSDRGHRRFPEIFTTQCMHHAIAVSDSTQSEWKRRHPVLGDRMSVIPNGIDVASYERKTEHDEAVRRLGLPADAFPVIATIGRLAEQKGHRYLLEAAAGLLGDFPKLQVVLAGDGPLRDMLAEQARELGMENHVRFAGHCSDIQPILDAADVFALPSLWEAMPFSLLEAIGGGVPVVATDVAGVAELITTDVSGMLVPPQNAPAFSEALKRLLAQADHGRGMAKVAKARVEAGFSLKAMLMKTSGVYRSSSKHELDATVAD